MLTIVDDCARDVRPSRSIPRWSRTYAFRTFLDHGVRLAFGTDWEVAPLDPLLTVYAAVTRATLDGKNPNGWFREQKLSIAEAIEAYTMGSAYAEFQEKETSPLVAAIGPSSAVMLAARRRLGC